MKSLEQSNDKIYPPSSRGKRQRSLRPRGCLSGTGSRKLDPELTRKDARSFAEDFYFEHSSSGLSIVQTAVSVRSDLVAAATSRRSGMYLTNCPNCIFLG